MLHISFQQQLFNPPKMNNGLNTGAIIKDESVFKSSCYFENKLCIALFTKSHRQDMGVPSLEFISDLFWNKMQLGGHIAAPIAAN